MSVDRSVVDSQVSTWDIPLNNPLAAAQADVERQSMLMGIDRYNDMLTIRGQADVGPGLRAVHACIEGYASALKADLDTLRQVKKGRKARYLTLLDQSGMDPYGVAYIALRTTINGMLDPKGNSIHAVTVNISNALLEHLNWVKLSVDNARLMPRIEEDLNKISNEHVRRSRARTVIRTYLERQDEVLDSWTDAERYHLGLYLLEVMRSSTGLIEFQDAVHATLKRKKGFATLRKVVPSETLADFLKRENERIALTRPFYLPMVIPPRPWTNRGNGGYLYQQFQLVKTRNKDHRRLIDNDGMPLVYQAVNLLQSTAYRINFFVMSTLMEAYESNSHIANLADAEPAFKPTPAPEGSSEEAVKAYKVAARTWYTNEALRVLKRTVQGTKLSLAQQFSKFPSLYFPVMLDWRGRAYPRAGLLNPQGDDLAKGLLEFSEGKPLGRRGAYWLAVHIANVFGVDKVSFEDRVRWTLEHSDKLIDSAKRPLDGDLFWTTADGGENPWQALAACKEWLGYIMDGDDFVSHLPIGMDGSCNGLQHLSAMLKDSQGGREVNLVDRDTPKDIYSVVAEKLKAKLEVDPAPEAADWLQVGITRKLVKRSVMTTPYGVTLLTIGNHMSEYLKEYSKLPKESWMKLGTWLGKRLQQTIHETVVGADTVMSWFQQVAGVFAKAGKPLVWVAPNGFPVVQFREETSAGQLAVFVGGKYRKLDLMLGTGKLSTQKQKNGAAPNIVHSFDAAHMMATVMGCHAQGVESLAMIHDSYATHAADVDRLNAVLRTEFADLYSTDVLADLYAQWTAQDPSLDIPEPPTLGDLDVHAVRYSRYFFA